MAHHKLIPQEESNDNNEDEVLEVIKVLYHKYTHVRMCVLHSTVHIVGTY